jgi:hypothetical protein
VDWNGLRFTTNVWKGDWQGMTGVSEEVRGWFDLGPGGLVLKRAELHEGYDLNSPPVARWPRL